MSFAAATRTRSYTSTPSDGSRTLTSLDSRPREEGDGDSHLPIEEPAPVVSLRLRGGPRPRNQPRVVWDEDVVDNEGAGKKKSKICCIYHKPRRFDESSSESSSESDSDASCDHHHTHSHNARRRRIHHRHEGGSDGEGATVRRAGEGEVHGLEEGSSSDANKYEQGPSGRSRKGKGVVKDS